MMSGERRYRESAALRERRAALTRESSDGRALSRKPENNPVCLIRVDETAACVVVIWQEYATSTQLRFTHEHILHLLQRHGLRNVLGDDTVLPMIQCEDQAWIVNDRMPRAIAAGLRAAASKSPAAHFGRVSVDSGKEALSANITIRSFEDFAEAREWIAGVEA